MASFGRQAAHLPFLGDTRTGGCAGHRPGRCKEFSAVASVGRRAAHLPFLGDTRTEGCASHRPGRCNEPARSGIPHRILLRPQGLDTSSAANSNHLLAILCPGSLERRDLMQAETQSLALERTRRRQRAEHHSSALMADWGEELSLCNDGHFAEARSRCFRRCAHRLQSQHWESVRGGGVGRRRRGFGSRIPAGRGSPLSLFPQNYRSSQHFCFSWTS